MKKIIYFFIVFIPTILNAQWEFNYFVLKAGANHHLLSPQPEPNNSFFLNTLEGEQRLIPDSAFIPDYVPGFQVGFDFHFDFQNDKAGIVVGAQYLNQGISAKYTSLNNQYHLLQTHRINSLSIPAFVKLGREIFDQQFYIFLGARFNVNFGLQTVEKVDWIAQTKSNYSTEDFFVSNNIGYLIGINFLVFNFEFNFYPQTFLNKEYTYNVGSSNDKFMACPYSTQPDNLMFLQTSLYVPISKWTTSKSYFINNIVRRLK